MKHIGYNALVALVLVSDYVLKKVDGYDDDFSVNVAYGKPANQSSTYIGNPGYKEPNGFPYIASLAVDGIRTTNFHGNSCSHTLVGQSSPWWEVDLQELYDVSRIKIYQRDDANERSLEGFVVDGMQSDANYFTIDHSGSYSTGEIAISLQPKRRLKSIRIRLLKDNAFICLCEVEVFAEVNVALGKSASQSSTYDGSTYTGGNDKGLYNASLAVDGNPNTNFNYASCSQTTPNTNTFAWWKVTLNGPYAVIGLRIYQRTDGLSANWLYGYKLFGQLGNRGYEEIATPSYQLGVINIRLEHIKIFSEIKVELNVSDFRGICLCEVQVFADMNECRLRDSRCHNIGLCTNTDGVFSCECLHGYTGHMCETDIDECKMSDSSCHNHGRCSNTYGGFSCECANGYTGVTCETDIDECKMPGSACHNHGRCTNTDGSFSCECANGYTGVTCETDIDECKLPDSACHNHGQCTNSYGGFSCECANGYTGVTCETDIDECEMLHSACHNHGQCTNTVGGFSCLCNNSYTGDTCDMDIDECTQAGICHYHGQCSNTDGSFACNCSAGYKGTTCENDIDESLVQNSTCHNHGQCLNTEGSFLCICNNSYTGIRCETALHEMNADQEQSNTCLVAGIIAGPLCLILLVTNTVTCLQLRRHESCKKKKRNNFPDDATTAHKVNARDHKAQAKVNEGISAYEFVEVADMETRKNKSNGSENNPMEPYDSLQKEARTKSEYDKLTFEKESSLNTT